jgi:hypothetical protein
MRPLGLKAMAYRADIGIPQAREPARVARHWSG